jgi:hypothetical protein
MHFKPFCWYKVSYPCVNDSRTVVVKFAKRIAPLHIALPHSECFLASHVHNPTHPQMPVEHLWVRAALVFTGRVRRGPSSRYRHCDPECACLLWHLRHLQSHLPQGGRLLDIRRAHAFVIFRMSCNVFHFPYGMWRQGLWNQSVASQSVLSRCAASMSAESQLVVSLQFEVLRRVPIRFVRSQSAASRCVTSQSVV